MRVASGIPVFSSLSTTSLPYHSALAVYTLGPCVVWFSLLSLVSRRSLWPPRRRPSRSGPAPSTTPTVPTLQQVVGHAPGEEITSPEQVGAYLRALAQAAPDRTRLVEYARTWEGRPLWLFVIGNAERIARLDALKGDIKQFADPRGLSSADADRLVATLPVVVWLVHGVHGNEISSSDAALLEAYHLLAARGDAGVDAVLRDALVLIDPMQNPDGRARFLFQNLQGRAATPDPAPYNAEHDEPWPGGRSNHYLFDMNRDWFAQTQPETRGRIRIALDYFPQVNVDLHEQGGNNTYYFAPPADPLNPHYTKAPDRRLRPVRPGQRRPLRRARLALLHPRGLRRLLPGLRRQLADVPRLDRHDLRAGVGAGAVVHPRRRHRDDLPRRRDAPLQRGDHHRDHRRPQPRASGARLPGVPAQRRDRGAEGRGARVRAGARARPVAGPSGWRATWRPRASRCGAPPRR